MSPLNRLLFISHMVQIIPHAMGFWVGRYVSFISHMVQIIHEHEIALIETVKLTFISHMVQIIPASRMSHT